MAHLSQLEVMIAFVVIFKLHDGVHASKVRTPDGGARAGDAPGQVGVAWRPPAGALAPGL